MFSVQLKNWIRFDTESQSRAMAFLYAWRVEGSLYEFHEDPEHGRLIHYKPETPPKSEMQ